MRTSVQCVSILARNQKLCPRRDGPHLVPNPIDLFRPHAYVEDTWGWTAAITCSTDTTSPTTGRTATTLCPRTMETSTVSRRTRSTTATPPITRNNGPVPLPSQVPPRLLLLFFRRPPAYGVRFRPCCRSISNLINYLGDEWPLFTGSLPER